MERLGRSSRRRRTGINISTAHWDEEDEERFAHLRNERDNVFSVCAGGGINEGYEGRKEEEEGERSHCKTWGKGRRIRDAPVRGQDERAFYKNYYGCMDSVVGCDHRADHLQK